MRYRNSKLAVAVVLLTLFAVGCAQHAHQLRGAQDSFSRGAELELAQKYEPAVGATTATEDAQVHYALAMGLANGAIADHRKDLERDSLYGTALTIKALAAWRLGDRKAARAAARDALAIKPTESGANRLWPRDSGICSALDAILMIDDIAARAGPFVREEAAAGGVEVMKKIMTDGIAAQAALAEAASAPAIKNHRLQIYFALAHCELAFALVHVASAAMALPAAERAPILADYMKIRTAALDRLGAAKALMDGNASQGMINYYQDRLTAFN